MNKLILLLLLSTFTTTVAQATFLRLDTSVLDPNRTWYIDFQLVDGDSADNNTVTAAGLAVLGPSALISFVPSALLRFDLTWTSNFTNNGLPDTFSFAVLDENFDSIVTTGLGASLVILLDGSAPMRYAASNAYNNVIPEFEQDQTAVPEPSALVLISSAALLTAALNLNRFRHKPNAKR